MAKISWELDTLYDIGDTVIFKHCNITRIGVVQAFSVDNNTIWYNILSDKQIFSYSGCGDIAEFDIIGKIEDKSLLKKLHESEK